MKPGNRIISNLGTTVFTVMSQLAAEHGAINLGQGFPDGNGPDDVRAKAAAYLEDQSNQYPPMLGLPVLRQAVAAHAKRFYGLNVDPAREVMVTSGATEALAACIFAVVSPGDEVVVIEPVYDSYMPIIRLAGGVPKIVRLSPPHWNVPRAELAAAFGPRTKALILNTPMNPTGKVFTAEELSFIADLLKAHDAYAICDEVYEHLVFAGARHTPLITLPDMRDRCFKIGSAGKTFSLTGWKVGYVTAAPDLLRLAGNAHQFLTFTTPPNLQRAVAYGLGKDDLFFTCLGQELQHKRDLLGEGLRDLGFVLAQPQGTYFLNVDFAPLGFAEDDVAFCRRLTMEARVAAIPVSAFYESDAPRSFIRFAFCKSDEMLHEALNRLADYFGKR